ncbi:methyltransferase domain protein [Ceratobasidium sp. AG-Ba]|nr:methyltransferase domain protein [Ceratobasidium sp. AG-Ba]QRW10939.1 methyltransferase domain protein [Ceratobasidium sp. AG-Ba]
MAPTLVPSPESPPSTIYSETESAMSGITIQSDDLPGYFVMRHGRQQPANDSIVKWFPFDNIRRHALWYYIIRSLFGGDYVGPFGDIVIPNDGRQRQVLELGTKAGTWVQAMATQFPHVQFRSVDVVPVVPHVPRRNIIFEVYDFTAGILLEDESQDVVFLNMILEVVKDYRTLIHEVQRVIRPGGMIQIRDYSSNLWDSEDITVPAQHRNPQGYRLSNFVRRHLSTLGIDPDTCEKVPQWLSPSSDVWDRGQKGFKDIQSVFRAYPAFPHEGLPCADHIDIKILPYLRHLTEVSMRDTCGLLQDSGLEEKEVRTLIDDAIEELKRHESCAMFKFYCIYGIKI